MIQFLRLVVLAGIFIIPMLTLYVANSHFFPYITGKNFSFRIIVEIIFAAWLLLALLEPKYRPQWSWILISFTALTGYMFVASLLAYNPHTALWSNYERMDGFVMLVHVWGYLVVLTSMLRTKTEWWWFFHTSLAIAVIVVLYGLNQLQGNLSYRIDSTLGNSTYMGIYMLFHIGIAAYLALQTNSRAQQLGYGLLMLLFALIMVQTGTRGTVIGFAVGALVTVGYVAAFGWRYPQTRKVAIGGCVAMLLLGAGFYGVKDMSFVQNHYTFARIANIDLEKDLEIRRIVWGMAWEGVKERPLTGWGIGNYNFVFNQNYDPRMYNQEQWFDRVHNLVIDWLIYGGVIGLLLYGSIFLAVFYYLIYRPWRHDDQRFTVLEQALLVGLLVGYILHNLVVFDNLISYIFFAVFLAFIHQRVASPWTRLEQMRVSPVMATQLYAPLIFVAMIATVYFVNVPHQAAAKDLILALRSNNITERYEIFDRALTRGSFGQQEIVEQFVQQAIQVSQATEGITPDVRAKFLERADAEIQAMIERKPGDARLHVFAASFYRATNNLEQAERELEMARTLSPKKQTIILQQGANALAQENPEGALEFFREAHLLDKSFPTPLEYYIALLFETGEREEALTVIETGDEQFFESFANNDYVAGLLNRVEEFGVLARIFEKRVEKNVEVPQTWASLAFLYYRNGEPEKAVEALERAVEAIPSFATTASCLSENIKAGNEPEEGCI